MATIKVVPVIAFGLITLPGHQGLGDGLIVLFMHMIQQVQVFHTTTNILILIRIIPSTLIRYGITTETITIPPTFGIAEKSQNQVTTEPHKYITQVIT